MGSILTLVGVYQHPSAVSDTIIQTGILCLSISIIGCYGISQRNPVPIPFWLFGYGEKDIADFSDKELSAYYSWLQFYSSRPIKLLASDQQVTETLTECKNELQSRYLI